MANTDDREAWLRSRIADLHKEYNLRIQPFMDELVQIDSRRVRSPIISKEQIEAFCETRRVQPNPLFGNGDNSPYP